MSFYDDVYAESVHDWLDERERDDDRPSAADEYEPETDAFARRSAPRRSRAIWAEDFHDGPLDTSDPF